jgi:D-methionine transport system ATP-binding protein
MAHIDYDMGHKSETIMIEIRQLYKTYILQNKPIEALHNINLSIQAGEIFGIFGASGAGKSTLLRSLNLLERPDRGQVIISGTDLMSLSSSALKQWRRKIGMIFQHFYLLESRTVFGNVALPLELMGMPPQDIEREVHALLELVNLRSHHQHYPHQLSGGQKQRVAIARALATKPRLLLCDEATSALDPQSTAAILSLLKDINRRLGVTIVLITHEMDVIKQICHRGAVLDHGHLVESGTVLKLYANPESNITRQLVQKALHLELPSKIQQNIQADPDENKSHLVRLTFVGKDSDQPLITTLIKKFDLTINIVQANIETIQDVTVGYTVCQFSGDTKSINEALAYINLTSIKAEVLGYV